MKKTAIFAYLPIAVAVVLVLWGAASYNGLLKSDQAAKQQWAQVENQLQRRSDLIPNYVSVVKAYARHEKELFEAITNARTRLSGAQTPEESMNASNELSGVLSRLLAITENYPQLRSSENFLRLQDELAGTENRLAVARRNYNLAVQDYNTRAKRFPTVLIIRVLPVPKERPFFQVPQGAKQAPKVDM